MKTINYLVFAVLLAYSLTACKKESETPPSPVNATDMSDAVNANKQLLLKVTGHNNPIKWNFFEYDGNWDYLTNYSYSKGYKALQQVGFFNTGSWDFTYKQSVPNKILDYSFPGVDQGYWKFYYNNNGLLNKMGLAFSTTEGPSEYEFYGYDDHSNLTSIIYGKYIDTPYWKQTYNYDAHGNLTSWQLYFAIGFKNSALQQGNKNVFNDIANTLPLTTRTGEKNFRTAMMRKVTTNATLSKIAVSAAKNFSPGADSNVIYDLFFTVAITADGKHNPYNQQRRILFYPYSRNYTADWNVNFMALLKSNPVQTVWTLAPNYGSSVATSNFTYTYDANGYPLTSHEQMSDPDAFLVGLTSYTQDRQYQYVNP